MSALRHLLWVWKRWSWWCLILSNTYWSRLYKASDKEVFLKRRQSCRSWIAKESCSSQMPDPLKGAKIAEYTTYQKLLLSMDCHWAMQPLPWNLVCQLQKCSLYPFEMNQADAPHFVHDISHPCTNDNIQLLLDTLPPKASHESKNELHSLCNWIRCNCICKTSRIFNLES